MFCTQCGHPLNEQGRCSHNRHHGTDSAEGVPSGTQAIVLLPKPSTIRRLSGSALEFGVYAFAALWIIPLSPFFLDIFVAIPLFLMIALRDARSGRLSIEKRLGRMRVVKHGTSTPIDNRDALRRNGYYLALIGLTVFPLLPVDALAVALFKVAVAVDVLLITFRRDGRRLGDLIAGTQVVKEARGDAP